MLHIYEVCCRVLSADGVQNAGVGREGRVRVVGLGGERARLCFFY